ncbi:PEP/pyruvate-binding domain-containing protein [Microbacterium sp.]|uniref:PEP/pyruvate-binding domain-containing protein n=1 Tax=Microbacterium sp. TaxID=51671 RepID=UPI003A851420
MDSPLCTPLTDVRRTDLALAGGKGANLGELIAAGFDVPAGFVVTTAAYRAAIAPLDEVDAHAVAAAAVPAAVDTALRAAYAELDGGPVAVRSSATAEDLPGAAFAGQQDTFLGIVGDEALRDAVRRCWASLWTDRAIAYRERLRIPPESVAIAVVVQRMVPADYAGVMLTADPVTGARDRVVIDASPGLGEAVVSGLVTPDHAVVDEADRVVAHTRGRRETVIRAAANGGTRTESGGDEPALTDGDLAGLARVGRRIAAHFGTPQDIEWAITERGIAILQARPMTALPPAPIALSRLQRFIGPVLLELLPRRPYPLEFTTWSLMIGAHVQGMVDGIAGLRLHFADIMPAHDAIVQEFVPYQPHPTGRTPRRVLRTIAHLGRDPRRWRTDTRYAQFRAATAVLAAQNPRELSWSELVSVPPQAAAATDLMTALRIAYLPPAAAAMVRLRLILVALGRTDLFADLLLGHRTVTQRANDELAAIAAAIRADADLAGRAAECDGDELWALVRDGAPRIRAQVEAFLDEFGHRETTSILLGKDPTWGDEPGTMMALVAVLLGDEPDPRPARFETALATLLAHPVVRALRLQPTARRLADRASTGVLVREDSHFELTRTMPPVRHALIEAGRRLAEAGAIDDPEDAWFLTYGELRSMTGPDDTRVDVRAAALRRRAAYAERASAPLIAPSTLYPNRRAGDAVVAGTPGGGGRAQGPVRVIHDVTEFARLQPGEVLVCPATNPSWTPLFARAAAVVVDNGGVASHAAIVAREYGLPAVMGTGDGTRVLTDGDLVRVDGDLGTVTAADE